MEHQCLFCAKIHFYECFYVAFFLVMKLLTSQNYVLFLVEYGPTFGVICVITARWPNVIYVTEGSNSTVLMYEVGEYNGKPRMCWKGEYISINQRLLHGKVFCGFKQCVNDTWSSFLWFQTVCEWYVHGKLFHGFKQCMNTAWQSILLFQAIDVEVFCDFNQYVNATWLSNLWF